MKKLMTERDLERLMIESVKQIGGRAYKWVSPGNNGVPDRIVFFPGGRVLFVELKTETGRESSLQKLQKRKLQRLGQCVYTVHGVREMADFFRDEGYEDIARSIQAKAEALEREVYTT